MSSTLKAQDILAVLKVWLEERRMKSWNYQSLGQSIGISGSQAFQAVARAEGARLLLPAVGKKNQRVARRSLEEFLIHGLKYAFPASIGALRRGIPTAHSSAPLNQKIVASQSYVWEHPRGWVTGASLSPLYKSAPAAAERDPELHELLALVDAIRVGRARERELAEQELHNRLSAD